MTLIRIFEWSNDVTKLLHTAFAITAAASFDKSAFAFHFFMMLFMPFENRVIINDKEETMLVPFDIEFLMLN